MTAAEVGLAVSTVIFAARGTGPDGRKELWLPLVRRIRDPFRGLWALPGGPLRPDEDLEASAARSLHLTTGLQPGYLEQLYAFGGLTRSADAAERVVSIVYWASIRADQASELHADLNVSWLRAADLPPLAFDHDEIVDYALQRLRNKITYSRVAFSFLGETFTLAELREVHEAILGAPLDPANFRRQALASGAVIDTGTRLEGTRHRPPRLYRYNSTLDLADRAPAGRTPQENR
ncbi:NUDIX domain-containing protein [Kocuria sp. LUK]|uniref:NUDIX hydrolase n=1 Tax=Kocuria TaxID=57493 RepID=UPI001E4410B2|nr:NUDIX domain-containing protein [Kocuria sp. LUK]MCD1144326.1 NUDIX domain-containing protein [Kocuria sp. LUK]